MLRISIVAAVLLAFAGTASADTLSYADAIDKLASACGKDINKHCRSVRLGQNRVRNCLEKNDAKRRGGKNQNRSLAPQRLIRSLEQQLPCC